MMQLRHMLAAAAGLQFLMPGSARPDEPQREPYEWVRTLEAVQQQIGDGSTTAHALLPKLLTEIADEIERIESPVLLEPRNIRAIIVYTLSGGSSKSVRKLLSAGPLPPLEEKIARGSLAYAEGKYSEATEHFRGVEARKLGPGLAGRVALVQSILTYKSDLKAAIALLDVSRLFAIGTLVEEAALRRQVVLVASAREQDRFERLSHRYFRRYKASVYADYFKQQFSVAAAGLDYSAGEHRLQRLGSIVESAGERERIGLYVQLAEKAIFLGNLPLTQFAAAKGTELSKPQTIERTRAELYAASAAVTGDATEEAVAKLRSIPASVLNPADEGLLWAALAVAGEVMRSPQAAHGARAPPDPSIRRKPETMGDVDAKSETFGGTGDLPADDTVSDAAKRVMAQVDQLLSEKVK